MRLRSAQNRRLDSGVVATKPSPPRALAILTTAAAAAPAPAPAAPAPEVDKKKPHHQKPAEPAEDAYGGVIQRKDSDSSIDSYENSFDEEDDAF